MMERGHEALAASTYPKLLFAAEPGALIAPAFAEELAGKLTDCRFVQLGDGLHFLQEDHPEAIGQGDGITPEERYPDFAMIAKGFKWGARNVSKKSEIRDALVEMIEYPGPYLLDVQVPYQEHVLPMIPSGMTVKDLIKK